MSGGARKSAKGARKGVRAARHTRRQGRGFHALTTSLLALCAAGTDAPAPRAMTANAATATDMKAV
jgi:uncharacterized membrane-anchored protein